MKILFVCSHNTCRSPTAEWLYARNAGHQVASAGIAEDAPNPVDRDMLVWADRIIVFEQCHRSTIRACAPDLSATLTIDCLDIPDQYAFKNMHLISLLTQALTHRFGPPARLVSARGTR